VWQAWRCYLTDLWQAWRCYLAFRLASVEGVTNALTAVLEGVNASLSNIEKVRKFILADAPFTTDNGLLTPTMKIRRHKIKEKYGEQLEALYR